MHAKRSGGSFLVLLSQKVAGFCLCPLGRLEIWESARVAAMDTTLMGTSESRFSKYVEGLVSVIGHADRAGPVRDYCVGLMMPGDRKSVEPMAAITAPHRTAAQHQSLLHFVGYASWADHRVLARVREMVQPAIERHGPIRSEEHTSEL